MLVIFNRDFLGVQDGETHPTQFKNGEKYDLKGDLLRVAIGLKVCEEIKEEKMNTDVPENKMLDHKQEKKKGK